MKGIKRFAAGIGRVALAVAGGMLFPVLIWVGLGVALYGKAHEGGTERGPAPTMREAYEGAH